MPTLPLGIIDTIRLSESDSKTANRRVGSLPDFLPDTVSNYARYRAVAKSDRHVQAYGAWGTLAQADGRADRYRATYPDCEVYLEIMYGYIERFDGE